MHMMLIVRPLMVLLLFWGQSGSCGNNSKNSNTAVKSGPTSRSSQQATNQNVSTQDKNKEKQSPSGSDEQWGGNHVHLVMKSSSSDLEFDCAHGTITEEIKPDNDGNFDVAGTFVREGGPTRLDESSKGHPARYVGRITQDSMTFQIHLKGNDQPTETFTLTRGRQGRLRKCK